MKAYFIAPLAEVDPTQWVTPLNIGGYHFINLGDHGAAGVGFALVVQMDSSVGAVPADWAALPHLLDATTTMAANAQALAKVGVVGATAVMTTFSFARSVGNNISPAFLP